MKDYTGREIKVGDTIVFPRRQGAHMWLTDGMVSSINYVRGTLLLDNHHEVQRIDRCVVVSSPPPVQPKPVRYFVHPTGFSDNTRYVVLDEAAKLAYTVLNNGERGRLISPQMVRDFHKEGWWVELTPKP